MTAVQETHARRGPSLRAQGVNGRLMDALLRHRHFLLRMENGVVRDAAQPLRAALAQVRADLAGLPLDTSATPLQMMRRDRLVILERRLEEIVIIAQTDSTAVVRDRLRALAAREIVTQNGLLRRIVPDAISLDLVGPDPARIEALLTQPLGGVPFAERMARNFGDLRTGMQRSLATSVALGEGTASAGRRLARDIEVLGVQRATLIARTEIQRIANATQDDLYQRNGDVVAGVQWVATLDARTCPICGTLDGKVWELKEQRPLPPAHAACRCIIVPVTRGSELFGDLPPSTRASMTGQVPETLTYRDWFAQQSPAFQREILGPARFARFQAGQLTLDGMVKDLRVLPLDALPFAEN